MKSNAVGLGERGQICSEVEHMPSMSEMMSFTPVKLKHTIIGQKGNRRWIIKMINLC